MTPSGRVDGGDAGIRRERPDGPTRRGSPRACARPLDGPCTA